MLSRFFFIVAVLLSIMKGYFILVCTLLLVMPLFGQIQDPSFGDDSSDDFAEFEDFDADDDFVSTSTPKQQDISDSQGGVAGSRGQKTHDAGDNNDDFANIYENDDNDDDGIVEEEDNEFEHFKDEEEFEGFSKGEQSLPVDQKTGEPKLTMAKVPLHFRYVLSCKRIHYLKKKLNLT